MLERERGEASEGMPDRVQSHGYAGICIRGEIGPTGYKRMAKSGEVETNTDLEKFYEPARDCGRDTRLPDPVFAGYWGDGYIVVDLDVQNTSEIRS